MPWINDANNERVYKPSIYTKEELPTWSEVYEEFFLKRYYESRHTDPCDQRWTEQDLYWKIPRYQFLLATVCNQFNKMLFEDGYKTKLIHGLVENGVMTGINGKTLINDIKFVCDVWDDSEIQEKLKSAYIGLNCAPYIYTIPHPDDKENPFITEYQRLDITTIKEMQFRPVIDLLPGINGRNNHAIYEPLPDGDAKYDFEMIMDIMIKPFRDYFEGSGVGWKDEDGNLIADQENVKRCPSGYDPAL